MSKAELRLWLLSQLIHTNKIKLVLVETVVLAFSDFTLVFILNSVLKIRMPIMG